MSNTPNVPELLSELDIVNWLKNKPRTSGWAALLVYDRLKANQLLMQEYIDRFSGEQFFPPITDTVTITENQTWEYLYEYRLDAPRISFERAAFDNSLVTMTMNIMGGTQLTVSQNNMSPKAVSKIEWIDALQGPRLTAQAFLTSAPVEVDEAEQVHLDMKDAFNFQLTFAQTQYARDEGGKFFKLLFDAIEDPRKKRFLLNKLEPVSENDFLDPVRGALRIYPAPGARVRSSPNYGDGAILYFVAVKDTTDTDVPFDDSGWVYPLPQERSSLVLLGHHALVKRIVADGVRNMSEGADIEIEFDNAGNTDAPVGDVTIVSGATGQRSLTLSSVPFTTATLAYRIPFAAKAGSDKTSFRITTGDGKLTYTWVGTSTDLSEPAKLTTTGSAGTSTWNFNWRMEASAQFVMEDGSVILRRDPNVVIEASAGPRHPMDAIHEQHLDKLVPAIEASLREALSKELDKVMEPSREIDLFRLHGLMFRGDNVVDLKSVYYPTDLAMFGHVSPKLTTFVVEPLEPIVAPGSKTTFTLVPPAPGGQKVTWSVEEVPGFDGIQGSIDQNGVYTAPAASTIPGQSYTFARIKASTTAHESSALARVVVRDVVVNPIVMSSSLIATPTKISAGTMDRGSLDWTINSPSDSTLKPIDIDANPEFDPGDYWYIPGTTPTGEPFSVDEIIVTNPRTKNSHSCFVLVYEKETSASIKIVDKPGLPDNQVQLQFGDDPENFPSEWKVLGGNGEINGAGLFTFDPATLHRFAIISAKISFGGFTNLNALILPIPMVDLSEVQHILA